MDCGLWLLDLILWREDLDFGALLYCDYDLYGREGDFELPKYSGTNWTEHNAGTCFRREYVLRTYSVFAFSGGSVSAPTC